MFTGIVKLAQVDDYINPSQNCIQPKIMKQDKEPQKATVSLNDCLACSGCITSAQSVLIEQMSINKLLSLLQKDHQKPIVIIISPQVVLALSLKYERPVLHIYDILIQFFKKKINATLVLDLWEGIQLCHELAFQQFIQMKQKTIICSECPGWVCYAQKTLTQQIVSLMSRVKSPQQVLSRVVKQKLKNSFIVTIAPCYDKKLQAIRFNIEENVKEVDITITTLELIDLYQTLVGHDISDQKQIIQPIKIDRIVYCQAQLAFINDQAGNGYIQNFMTRLQAENIKKTEIKNSDFIQYEAQVEGKTVKMAKCYGFRNIQRVVQMIKRKKCQYSYVQIMACPGACYSGGGQPRLQNLKSKEITEKFSNLSKTLPPNNQKNSFDEILLKDEQKFKANYKVVQQTLTQAVMNW